MKLRWLYWIGYLDPTVFYFAVAACMLFSFSDWFFDEEYMLWINLVWGVGDFSGSVKLYMVCCRLPSKKGEMKQ